MRATGVMPLDTGLTLDSEGNWSQWGGSAGSWRPLVKWCGPRGSSTATAKSICLPPGHRLRVLCPAVTMSMTSPGYLVEELATGKLFHTADIIQVEDMPDGVALPDCEAGMIHEVDDREEVEQPRKRPGRTEGRSKPSSWNRRWSLQIGGSCNIGGKDAIPGASTSGRGLRRSQE